MGKSRYVLGVLFATTAFAQTSATLNAAPPAASTTTMPAPSPLTVLGVTGGANSASTGTAGEGSSPSIFTGTGGDATGTGAPATIGGAGGSFTVSTGNGGASGSGAGATAVGANGGDVIFALGAAGSYTSTMGTPGRNGRVIFPNGLPAEPSICGSGDPLNGLCLYWATNTVIGFSDNQGTVAGGLDDEGTRYCGRWCGTMVYSRHKRCDQCRRLHRGRWNGVKYAGHHETGSTRRQLRRSKSK